jgi:hypothetical protein
MPNQLTLWQPLVDEYWPPVGPLPVLTDYGRFLSYRALDLNCLIQIKHTHIMKRIILAVVFGVASLSSISTKAQVSVNINLGAQPAWGPEGYNHVDYYYLPDIESYYNVADRRYVYQDNGRWTRSSSLPARYKNYDLYKGYKVVMNSPRPYLQHNNNVKLYSKFKGGRTQQVVIRDSRDYKNKDHKPDYGRDNDRSSKQGNNNNQRGGRRG